MNNEVEKLEEKIKCLEESIIDFENSHIKQVNNLISLFSDVISILKEKKEEENKNRILIENTSVEKEEPEDFLKDLPDFPISEENNIFKNKSTQDIIDYIYNLKLEDNNENEQKQEEVKNNNDIQIEIPEINQDEIIKTLDNIITLPNTDEKNKIEIIEPNEIKNNIILKETYKVEKNIVPVSNWVEAFKKTDKWNSMKSRVKSFATKNDIITETGMI